MKSSEIKCPTCGKHNTWRPGNPYRPFCSDRCKLIDLGEWANETRKIPGKGLDIAIDTNLDNLKNEFKIEEMH